MTDYGTTSGTLSYKNSDGEQYFIVEITVIGDVEYGKTLQVQVTDAYGWNGAILQYTYAYSIYFENNKMFEITLYEDNTYTSTFLSISEIYEWYKNDYANNN